MLATGFCASSWTLMPSTLHSKLIFPFRYGLLYYGDISIPEKHLRRTVRFRLFDGVWQHTRPLAEDAGACSFIKHIHKDFG